MPTALLSPAQVTAVLDDVPRLAAIAHLEALDLPVAQIEKVLGSLAYRLGGEPLCAATYLDATSQHFIATSEGPLEDTPREISHCQYVIATGAWLCLNDASVPVSRLVKVRRALIKGEPLAAYLGFPLTFDGQTIGAVCAADIHTRVWSTDEHYAVYKASIAVRDLLESAR